MANMLIDLFKRNQKIREEVAENIQANDSDSSNDGFRKKVLTQAVDSYNQDYFRHPFRSYIYRLHMYADHLPKTRTTL